VEGVVTHGSVTSVGVVYARDLSTRDLARNVLSLLGPVLEARAPGRWPILFLGGHECDVWVEMKIKSDAPANETAELLEHFLESEFGEMEVIVRLTGIGPVEAVLRHETAVCGLLLDLPDAALFPARDPGRPAVVAAAIKEFMLVWYDASRFEAAFADHEAEFHVDPLTLGPADNPYALLALPSPGGGERPLDFHMGGWLLTAGGV
jgi:hypothetical protein